MGREEGLTKVLFAKGTKRVLGAGIVGVNAGELIAETVLALEMGADAEDLEPHHPRPPDAVRDDVLQRRDRRRHDHRSAPSQTVATRHRRTPGHRRGRQSGLTRNSPAAPLLARRQPGRAPLRGASSSRPRPRRSRARPRSRGGTASSASRHRRTVRPPRAEPGTDADSLIAASAAASSSSKRSGAFDRFAATTACENEDLCRRLRLRRRASSGLAYAREQLIPRDSSPSTDRCPTPFELGLEVGALFRRHLVVRLDHHERQLGTLREIVFPSTTI